jgi:hypothetical protein
MTRQISNGSILACQNEKIILDHKINEEEREEEEDSEEGLEETSF